MDYAESLIFFTVVNDHKERKQKIYRGLSKQEIAARTDLSDDVLKKKLTITGRGTPELREEDPYPYLIKRGNSYLIHKSTMEHLIMDRRHCKIFLRSIFLARLGNHPFSESMLIEDCKKHLEMILEYIQATIADLTKRGYLAKDASRAGNWYEPSELDDERERIYYAFLLGTYKTRAKSEKELAEDLQKLDGMLLTPSFEK
jgi:hypothetical protein